MHPCDDTETKKIFACRIERKVSSSLFDQGITPVCLCAVLSKLKSFSNFRRFIMANVNTDWMTVFCTEIQLSVNHFFVILQSNVRCVNLRDCLANYISNSEFPDDLYPFLFSALVLFFTLKMFQYSIRLAFALIRPIAFIVIILVTEF